MFACLLLQSFRLSLVLVPSSQVLHSRFFEHQLVQVESRRELLEGTTGNTSSVRRLLFRHSKVCLLTYYVTDVIVITIIMAIVIRRTREQLVSLRCRRN